MFCWANILFLSTFDPECSVIGERVGDKATQRPARKIPCVLRDAVVTDLARSISIKDGSVLSSLPNVRTYMQVRFQEPRAVCDCS